jgi:uncharacterized protein YkwD
LLRDADGRVDTAHVTPPRVVRVAVAALSVALCAGAAPAALGAQRHGHHRRFARWHACPHARLTPTYSDLALIRAATLCLVNRERIAHRERPLRLNMRLDQAAQTHTASMASDDYFEHFGPSGQTPVARMRAAGYISSSHVGYEVGENIAWGTFGLATPRAIVSAWMHSPGHRANILDRHYRDTGIGILAQAPVSLAHGQPGAVYTQDFGVIIR